MANASDNIERNEARKLLGKEEVDEENDRNLQEDMEVGASGIGDR